MVSLVGMVMQGCQTGAMALKIAPMNVFERQRPFWRYGAKNSANECF